ncbi:MAG: OmpH family outer membrane protein [Bacteroidia bacterium]
MKRIIFILACAFLALSAPSYAQHTKLGHINTSQLVLLLPEMKAADSSLQKFSASLESQLKVMFNEYQTKVADFKASEATMAEPVKQTKAKEVDDLEQRIRQFQEDAEASVQKKEQELLAPISKKVEDAIKAVAKEKGYAYIFDMSRGSVIYAQETDDIMPLVKTKLGLK